MTELHAATLVYRPIKDHHRYVMCVQYTPVRQRHLYTT